jgi:hypothetical protein
MRSSSAGDDAKRSLLSVRAVAFDVLVARAHVTRVVLTARFDAVAVVGLPLGIEAAITLVASDSSPAQS